jgi:hypothetical protein
LSGNFNTFLGFAAGLNNLTGNNNIFIGHLTGNPDQATQTNNSIAIGNGVKVSTSNTIVLGTTAQHTQIPGGLSIGGSNVNFPVGGGVAEFFNNGSLSGLLTGNVFVSEGGLNNILPSQVHLCIRTTNIGNGFGGEALARCTAAFSSVKNKTDIEPFTAGIEIVKRLRPVAFKWKADRTSDLGLNAEDVAEVAPQLVTRSEKGEVEDVREGGLNLLFINAFKQQQTQLEAQERRIEELKSQLEALKKIVCAANPQAAVCREER